MAREPKVSIGQYSDRGRKEINQDFHGAIVPSPPLLGRKGIAVAIADGIGSSSVGGIAAESAVKAFLTDYYCTPDSWSVKTAAHRVIAATNSWLHAQSRRGEHPYDRDKGYVCTLTVMVFRSRTAHIFHVGDARVFRVAGRSAEQLTTDHRVVLSSDETYLGRALGANAQIEIDYRAIPLETGDLFVLATDGVHDHIPTNTLGTFIVPDLDAAARSIAQAAHDRGSPDNLTIQIVRIEELPDGDSHEAIDSAEDLPLTPLLEPGTIFDGYRIQRELHASSRGHIYLATDIETNIPAAIKIPSIDQRGDRDYIRRFTMEEWIARRIDSAHVVKPAMPARPRRFVYTAMEFIDGQTLTQWMTDNPKPDLERVRTIAEQIAKGLRAFHRLEMQHRDLHPGNIVIDKAGTVKIVDFGSTRVAGLAEDGPAAERNDILGMVQYTAPETLIGADATPSGDLYSLGVIVYQMLTGALPYGAEMATARTKARQRKIRYRPAPECAPKVPAWVDGALRKAVHPDPNIRYGELSEFLTDLRQPNPEFTQQAPIPLIERNPLLFWQALCAVLICVIVLLLANPIRH